VNSTFVNANVYDSEDGYSADDVYLNGGPRPNAPCTAAGLPDGDYYFQVTDPSGSVLLSKIDNVTVDPIENRRVTVTLGLITDNLGLHSIGMGKCGNITVQLFPYLRTPNPGGEYKVWMTPYRDYACYPNVTNPCTIGFHGFMPSKSKTDNFKVVDYDGDETPDSEDACPDDPSNTCGGPGPLPS
jgi:hypothetical protein